MMEVEDRSIACGITKAARQLGVGYNHLWKVLTGRYESPSLVLKINKQCPSLLKTARCRIDFKKIIRDNRNLYSWDDMQERFVKKHINRTGVCRA